MGTVQKLTNNVRPRCHRNKIYIWKWSRDGYVKNNNSNMKYAITCLLIYSLTPIILAKLLVPKHDENKEVLRYPSHCIFIGMFGSFIIALAAVLAITDDHHIKTIYMLLLMLAGAFLLFCTLYLMLLGIMWKLEMYDTYFIFTNAFGIKKRYEYSQITEVKKVINRLDTHESTTLILGKKKILIENMTINFENFERTLKKHLRKNNCKAVFTTKKLKYR